SSTAAGWKDGELYEGHVDGALGDVLYRQSDGRFLTTSNLARLLAAQATSAELKGREVSLRGDDRVARTLRIAEVKEPGLLGTYHPIVLLELSPLRFRVLVPLEAASACLDRAIEMRHDHFARVCDRLPPRGGIVGVPEEPACQAVLAAESDIEHELDGVEPEAWRARHRDGREGVVALAL